MLNWAGYAENYVLVPVLEAPQVAKTGSSKKITKFIG
jgi:hypothetical protein